MLSVHVFFVNPATDSNFWKFKKRPQAVWGYVWFILGIWGTANLTITLLACSPTWATSIVVTRAVETGVETDPFRHRENVHVAHS